MSILPMLKTGGEEQGPVSQSYQNTTILRWAYDQE